MLESERRNCQRYTMNFPIVVSSTRAIESSNGWHYGEILDAGKYGVRMHVDNFGSLPVGTELKLVCQPAANQQPNNKCLPVSIKGRVVWEDAESHQFALMYTH